MNGTAAVLALLTNNDALTALLPAGRIMAGVLPQGTALPAIAVTPVSSTDLQFVPADAERFTTERVQVTVMAATFPSLQEVLAAARASGDAKAPIVAGISNVVVRSDGQGPWFMSEDAAIHIGTQDFRVSFSRPA